MKSNYKFIAPALMALSIFAYAPAFADGPGKNGDDTVINEPVPVVLGTGTGNDGGGVEGGDGKNGGGTDKNGGSTDNSDDGATGTIQVPKAMDVGKPGGNGDSEKNGDGVDKNGDGDPLPPPPKPPLGGVSGGKNGDYNGGGTKYHRNSGGDNWNYGAANITCVINGKIFRVRSTRECYVGVNYGGKRQVYRGYKKSRRVMLSGGVQGGYAGGKNGGGYVDGGGYAYNGGYSYAPQPIIRYYKPASRAAVMQTERRARRAARAQMSYGFVAQGGYAMQGGYAYGGGYQMQGGYAYGGGYQMQGGYAMQGGYGQKHRKQRRVRFAQPMYMPAPAYDAGYVVHYGPTISKDGGY